MDPISFTFLVVGSLFAVYVAVSLFHHKREE